MTAAEDRSSGDPEDAAYEGITVELLARIRAGEEEAWEALYRRYHDDLLFAVRAHLGPGLRGNLESEDVLQSVAIQALKALPDFEPRGPGSLRHYLHKMIVNKIRDRADYHAAAKRGGGVRLASTDLHRLPDREATDREPTYQDERFVELERAMRLLPPEMERVLVLRRVDGLSSKEAAEVLGKSDAAVRKLYSRAVARLGTLMKEREG